MRLTRWAFAAETSTVRPNLTVTGLRFLRRKLLRLPYIRIILPPPVTRKRAAVPLWVLSFSTLLSFGRFGGGRFGDGVGDVFVVGIVVKLIIARGGSEVVVFGVFVVVFTNHGGGERGG